jgi:hypothetical protein
VGRWPEINSCGPAEWTEGKVVCPPDLRKGNIKSRLRIDRCQLGLGSTDQSRLFDRFSGRPGIKSIKNGGADEN